MSSHVAAKTGWLAALLQPRPTVELFAIANYAALTIDIYLAHSVNDFEHWAEWIPFVFSIAAAPLLAFVFVIERITTGQAAGRRIAFLVGWSSVVIGVVGLLLHLDSQFFRQQTLHNLVYTAPFVAPLAYTGLGLLVIMIRMVTAPSVEWSQWVILLAAGGFAGNFVLSLADHAQNGFYNPAEWIPVIAAAFGLSFLLPACWPGAGRSFLRMASAVMVVEALVGLLGFYYHAHADLTAPAESLRDRLLYGAPVFAPLLFTNLALLGGLGLWSMPMQIEPATDGRSDASATSAA